TQQSFRQEFELFAWRRPPFDGTKQPTCPPRDPAGEGGRVHARPQTGYGFDAFKKMPPPSLLQAARCDVLASIRALLLPLVALSSACWPGVVPPSLNHPLENAHAPEFHELATSSWDVGLPGTPSTKVTVIDFWASWCDECQRTMPALERLYRDKKED